MFDLESARRQMIEQQIRAWEVLNLGVLDVFEQVPREEFVPDRYRELAFADMQLPLGHGQRMLAPQLEGRILQALGIRAGDRVLEVGTGSGFFAACLSRLANKVHSLEIFPDLAEAASERLLRLGYANVEVEAADAMSFDGDSAFDAIALTGSLPVYDPRFERALAIGGRLFAVVGPGPVMEARLITRTAETAWFSETLFETELAPLVHAARPPRFEF